MHSKTKRRGGLMERNWIHCSAIFVAAILAGGFAATQASAQQTQGAATTQSSTVPPPGTIGQRKENQQDRIAQGVKSGQLTAGETANLEHKEAGLNKEIRTDRKDNGGNLTNNEKQQINHQ